MAPFIYFLQVSLYAAIMWGIYFIVWRNRPLHTYSRVYLLASLILPVLLPFIHLPVSEQSAIASYSITLPAVTVPSGRSMRATHETSWPDVLPWLYLMGSVVLAALYIRAYILINNKLRRGRSVRHDGYTIITGTAIGPGTFGRRIFFPAAAVDDLILQHELAHIRAGHRYDSLVLQLMHVLVWVSPAHWLIGRELKTVHEFEADRMASEGVDKVDYASLLLSQGFGTPHTFAIAHSFFHHPLKRRIMMLQKMTAPKRSVLLIAAFALTAGFMSTVLLAHPRKPVKSEAAPAPNTAVADPNFAAWFNRVSPGEIRTLTDGSIAFKHVDEMPAFNGNMRDWLVKNLNIRDTARANRAKRGTTVQFTVTADGQVIQPRLIQSSGDAVLDGEAMRVIGLMPNWKPGVHKGKPVPVIFNLPIYFNPGEGC